MNPWLMWFRCLFLVRGGKRHKETKGKIKELKNRADALQNQRIANREDLPIRMIMGCCHSISPVSATKGLGV